VDLDIHQDQAFLLIHLRRIILLIMLMVQALGMLLAHFILINNLFIQHLAINIRSNINNTILTVNYNSGSSLNPHLLHHHHLVRELVHLLLAQLTVIHKVVTLSRILLLNPLPLSLILPLQLLLRVFVRIPIQRALSRTILECLMLVMEARVIKIITLISSSYKMSW